MLINKKKLALYLENGVNVLLIGKHGVGKTSAVLDVFEEAGLKWKYFSAATMDPWVDMIGVPKEIKDGDDRYLDLVRPKEFEDDEVEAIFMDEYNRAHKKIKNAVMELIQFKSINGKKYKNLKVVWAAVNPDDDDDLSYDVDPIDPAQKDRFHIHIHVPYKPDAEWFSENYGEIGEVACKWWNNLEEPQKLLVSPRRLEYALKILGFNGDVRDVFDKSINVSEFMTHIHLGNIKPKLEKFVTDVDEDGAKKFIEPQNIYDISLPIILNNNKLKQFFLPLLNKERLAIECEKYNVLQYVASNYNSIDIFKDTIDEMLRSGTPRKNQIMKILDKAVPNASNMDYEKVVGKNPTTTAFTGNNVDIPSIIGVDNITRQVVLDEIMAGMTPQISVQDSEDILDYLQKYCAISMQGTVVKQQEKILSLLNHAIQQLKDTNPLATTNEIYRAAFKGRSNLFAKLYNCKLLEKCLG